MTETGMILGQSYDDVSKRVGGCVGWPFPGVHVRLVDDHGTSIDFMSGKEGHLEVKGPQVFQSYWQRPEATRESFTSDGWFKTGDTAQWTREGGFKLLGRTSMDIIKVHVCGGRSLT
jgi:long-subunit acyl-CoA synthetase (AMP-forming)